MKLIYIYILLVIFGCSNPSIEVRNIDFKKYSIEVPSVWSEYSENGIDSKITGLITHLGDTIYFNYGKEVTGLDETVKVHSMQSKIHFDSIDWPYRNEMIFSDNATVEERQGIFLQEYYRYDSIDGKRVKVMLPKITGNGSTGIHFDSLNENGDKLTVVSNNLNSTTQQQLYQAFYTISFK